MRALYQWHACESRPTNIGPEVHYILTHAQPVTVEEDSIQSMLTGDIHSSFSTFAGLMEVVRRRLNEGTSVRIRRSVVATRWLPDRGPSYSFEVSKKFAEAVEALTKRHDPFRGHRTK